MGLHNYEPLPYIIDYVHSMAVPLIVATNTLACSVAMKTRWNNTTTMRANKMASTRHTVYRSHICKLDLKNGVEKLQKRCWCFISSLLLSKRAGRIFVFLICPIHTSNSEKGFIYLFYLLVILRVHCVITGEWLSMKMRLWPTASLHHSCHSFRLKTVLHKTVCFQGKWNRSISICETTMIYHGQCWNG